MTRQPQPPVPVAARQKSRQSMIGLAVIAAIAAVGALAQWRISGNARAFLPVVPVLLLLAATAIRPGLLAGTLILAGTTSAGWLLGQPLLGAAVGLAILGYGYVRAQRLPSDLQPEALVMLPNSAVGVGAEAFVAQFESLGYRQVGALTTPVDGFRLIITIMLGPTGDRYASVTDAVLTVTSTFGPRSLVTRNSASSLLAPEMLDNPVVGATPAQLDAAHTTALDIVTAHVAVDTLDPATTTEQALASELRELAWVRAQPTHLRPGGNRRAVALVDQPQIQEILAGWLTTPDPA